MRKILENAGAEVAIAASAVEAYELPRQWRSDVLPSDIGTPGQTRYELIARVRRLRAARSTEET